MLRMLIVEDEKLEREGLVDFFDWNSFGIEIAGVACDGIEGLEFAERIKPDIIITDIKMPGLDGITMSKKIRDFLPQAKIIILTGYDDFKYTKEAIRFRANAYILKPVEDDEMLNVIQNVLEECKSDRNMETKLSKGYYIERNKFVMDLLQGKLDSDEIERRIFEYKVDLKVKNEFIVIVIKLNEDKNKLLNSLSSQIENMINEHIFLKVNFEDEKVIAICLNISDKQNKFLSSICERLLKHTMEKELLTTIGVGKTVGSLLEIKDSFERAKESVEYGVFWNVSGLIYYKDILEDQKNYNEKIGEFIIKGNNLSKELIHMVASLEENRVYELLKEIFELFYQNKNVDKKYIYDYLYNIIYETSLLVFSFNKNSEEVVVSRNDFVKQFLELKSLKQMEDNIYTFFDRIIRTINEKRNKKDEYIIKSVIKLIEDKYMTDICLKNIASEVFLSPNYLGNIFKKYIGKSFNDYLSEYRMEKAKELLKTSNKKVSVIASEIGIPNTSYFCMVFKSIFGMSPREYQEIILRS